MTTKLRPGTVFAGYLIEAVLGGGGMGTVYLARHPRLPRRDAVKVLEVADPEFQARFIREAELTARLNHPNIVAVHDRGVEGDRLWIAMQYVDGADAAQLVRSGNAPAVERVLHIVDQAARGLDEAHRHGMVHRDVKPANIMIEPLDGRPDRVLVTDFGIGRATSETSALTEVGSVLATLAYAAPEQLAGARVDHRADIYALGCTLFELLTGAKPFPRGTPAAIIAAHLHDPPPRPTDLRPGLPPAIDAVVARALAKHPDTRYSSCGALAAAAAAAFGGVEVTRQVHPLAPPPARRRRTGPAVALAAAVLAVVLAVTGIIVWQRDLTDTAAPATTVTTTAAEPVTTTPATATWGSHAFIARSFPGLLPGNPQASGYQGMRCSAIDADRRPVDLTAPVEGESRLSCNGDKEPLHLLIALCNADGSRNTRAVVNDGDVVVGDERWERFSGTGRIVWRDTTSPTGQPAGALSILFDDSGRSKCQLIVYGGTSGQDLRDRWWQSAPI